jgi:hypothetical protein
MYSSTAPTGFVEQSSAGFPLFVTSQSGEMSVFEINCKLIVDTVG